MFAASHKPNQDLCDDIVWPGTMSTTVVSMSEPVGTDASLCSDGACSDELRICACPSEWPSWGGTPYSPSHPNHPPDMASSDRVPSCRTRGPFEDSESTADGALRASPASVPSQPTSGFLAIITSESLFFPMFGDFRDQVADEPISSNRDKSAKALPSLEEDGSARIDSLATWVEGVDLRGHVSYQLLEGRNYMQAATLENLH